MARDIINFDPFAQLDALQRRLFDGPAGTPVVAVRDFPTTDVYTTPDNKELVVETHLPAFSEGDVSVDIDKGSLVIRAEKQTKEEDAGKKYVVRETKNSVERRVLLPEQVDESAAAASFEHGVLKVTLPFKEQPTARRIEITKTGQ